MHSAFTSEKGKPNLLSNSNQDPAWRTPKWYYLTKQMQILAENVSDRMILWDILFFHDQI